MAIQYAFGSTFIQILTRAEICCGWRHKHCGGLFADMHQLPDNAIGAAAHGLIYFWDPQNLSNRHDTLAFDQLESDALRMDIDVTIIIGSQTIHEQFVTIRVNFSVNILDVMMATFMTAPFYKHAGTIQRLFS